MALNARQQRFCEEYIIDLNASQAAIRAGYSEDTARSIASELLTKPDIQLCISELKQAISNKNEGLAQAVIDELKLLGFSNIQDFLAEENEIKDLSKVPRSHAACVESVKKTITEFQGSAESSGTKTSVQIKMYDKISALEKLGRHLGIFEADNRQKSATITVSIDDPEDSE